MNGSIPCRENEGRQDFISDLLFFETIGCGTVPAGNTANDG
jgi:hypothetical protein